MTEAMNPWEGKVVEWAIPPRDEHGARLIGPAEMHVAYFHPGEVRMMEIARERGCTTSELEVLHLVKALCDGTIIDAEAKP